jgi:hypothetical protein
MKFALQAMILGLVVLAPLCGREPPFQVTMQVVDDEGRPVEGALAKVAYERPPRGASSVRIESASGNTDTTGRVVLQGKTALPGISYGVEKVGYYQVRGPRYHFKEKTWRRWQPWNPTIEVVLKRIKNPVPMYGRKVEKGLPVLNETIGYDLMMGDWTPPHGQGQTADFVLFGTLDKRGEDDFDFELRLTFSRPGDGIQRMPDEFVLYRDGSLYWAPAYEAPADGYVSEWRLRRWRHGRDRPIQSTFNMKTGYYFRVRSELDGDGRAVKALYGKIRGDFFSFTYYLNPDGTRNLEYDPQRNLLRPAGSRDRAYDLAP